jgi:hypothetical protein
MRERSVKTTGFSAGIVALTFAWAGSFSTVLANDSIAETAVGGISFAKTDAISMDSEDLYISRDQVRVRYHFTNTTNAPIDALVAFPLPEIPPGNDGGEEEAVFWGDAPSDLKFKTIVDGQPLALQLVEQAFVNGRDVTARLSSLGVPLNRFSPRFEPAINALLKPERDKLVAEKLIVDISGDEHPNWMGLWALRTTLTRRQTFPAQKTIVVEHEYKPLAGGAVGPSPQYPEISDFVNQRAKYCIEDDWIVSFNKLLRKQNKNSNASEIFLGYVLKTGANWKGPIKDFRLVVDKGKPDSLVSFCAQGVKKISPTQFEARYSNFTPTKDLDILIVDWPR